TAALLMYYTLLQYKEKGLFKGNEYVIKTIVTSDLLDRIAESFNVECYNVLTGFKYFAELIRNLEGKKKYIGGGEESYGYLPGDYVRDKDAVGSCALIAETAAWAKEHGMTMYELLIDIYLKYGLYLERLINLVRKGKEGAEEIKEMMHMYRNNPPEKINNSRVVRIDDYEKLVSYDKLTGKTSKLKLIRSDVLQFFLADGSKISVRPSGTEPKIKFYFSVNTKLDSATEFNDKLKLLNERIDGIISDLKLL
ncbi:MAG TPA: phospho-sugar mutase, partial [Bacteroidales bacterium]|nr:phospho-sugar mutase [Bacteroidales bacterium]